MANEQAEGILVDRITVAAAITGWCIAVDSTLEQRLCNEYPVAVTGLDPEQARIFGKRLADELGAMVARFFSEWFD